MILHYHYLVQRACYLLTIYVGISCFKNGPHEKEHHDYSLEQSGHGGSCDCGNMHAWKKAGYVKLHGGVH